MVAAGQVEILSVSLIHNERTKLTATWLNTLGAGSIVAGVFGPLIASASSGMTLAGPLTFSAVWLVAGVLLHLIARAILGRLRP